MRWLLIIFFVFILACRQMSYTATNLTELNAHLDTPVPSGATITLADGSYGNLDLQDLTFRAPVTIRAQNSGGAIFTTVFLDNVHYLSFDDVVVERPLDVGEQNYTHAVDIEDSSHISFSNSEFLGSDDDDYTNDPYAFTVLTSDNISVVDSTFHDLARGMVVGSSTNVTMARNYFYDISQDVSDWAGNTGLLIEGNVMTAMHGDGVVHNDFIQFQTASTPKADENVIIRGNFILESENDSTNYETQAIFLRDQTTNYQFKNFLIENNVIYTSTSHGISIVDDGPADFIVRNNTVLKVPGAAGTAAIAIPTGGGTNVQVTGNVASTISIDGAYTNSGNIIADPADYSDLFVRAEDGQSLTDFLPLPGTSVYFGNGVGAEDLLLSATKPLAFQDITRATDELAYRDVDFAAEIYPGGGLSGSGTISTDAWVDWDWGHDAETTTGDADTSHNFPGPGTFDVVMSIDDSAGHTGDYTKTVVLTSPLLVDLPFNGDLTDNGGAGGTVAWTETPAYDSNQADFDEGGASYVTVSGVSESLSGLTQISIAFTFTVGTTVSRARMLWLTTSYGIQLKDSGDLLSFILTTTDSGETIEAAAADAFDGLPHDVLATYDALTGDAIIYFDGSVLASQSGITGLVKPETSDLTIGSDGGTSHFDGQIDNVRIIRGIVTPGTLESVVSTLSSEMP